MEAGESEEGVDEVIVGKGLVDENGAVEFAHFFAWDDEGGGDCGAGVDSEVVEEFEVEEGGGGQGRRFGC